MGKGSKQVSKQMMFSAMEENEAKQGRKSEAKIGEGTILKRIFRKVFIDRELFQQRPEGNEGQSSTDH